MRNAAAKKAMIQVITSAIMTLSYHCVVEQSLIILPTPCAVMERSNSEWVGKMQNVAPNPRTTPIRIFAIATACTHSVLVPHIIPTQASVVDQISTQGHMEQCLSVARITLMTRPTLCVCGERK